MNSDITRLERRAHLTHSMLESPISSFLNTECLKGGIKTPDFRPWMRYVLKLTSSSVRTRTCVKQKTESSPATHTAFEAAE